MFSIFDLDNFYLIWSALLLEKSVIFLSQNLTLLSSVMLGFKSLLAPFSWCHVMIPILPAALLDILDAPVPFMVGITGSQLDLLEEERFENRVLVNIDTVELITDLSNTLPVVSPDFNGLKGKMKGHFRKFQAGGEPSGKRNSTLEREIAFQPKEEQQKACSQICNLMKRAFLSCVTCNFPSKPKYDEDGMLDIQAYQEEVI